MDTTNIPTHIAIIMDGNGRWAKQRGLPRTDGHKAGTETARAVVTRCRELGVKHLTLYTFSKENWSRPKDEISTLFKLLTTFLTKEEASLKKQGIRLKVLGEIGDMPMAVRQVLKHVMRQTKNCTDMTLNLALNYSGRDEILRAAKLSHPRALPQTTSPKKRLPMNSGPRGSLIRTSSSVPAANCDFELSALPVCLFGILLHGHILAGLLTGRAGKSHHRTGQPPTPFRKNRRTGLLTQLFFAC